MKGTIFDIERASFVDGPGIRTTVFFKGCNLACKWCHNPESQSPRKQMLFYKDKCTGCATCKEVCPYQLSSCDFCGNCALYCPHDAREVCGKEYTVEEVLSEILKDEAYYKGEGGVTFSGGECMLQIDFLEALLKACKARGVHTAVDTAGNLPWGYFERILPYTDLFLYDIKCVSEALHKEGTGVDGVRIRENLVKLSKCGTRIWVRVPFIPEFNGDKEEREKIAEFVNSVAVEKVEVLPYHALGEHKWEALEKTAVSYSVPTNEQQQEFLKLFK